MKEVGLYREYDWPPVADWVIAKHTIFQTWKPRPSKLLIFDWRLTVIVSHFVYGMKYTVLW